MVVALADRPSNALVVPSQPPRSPASDAGRAPVLVPLVLVSARSYMRGVSGTLDRPSDAVRGGYQRHEERYPNDASP